ncbi:phage tail tape measure C-terminal domain-containing protein, partial [Pantoea sp. SIMBA_072]
MALAQTAFVDTTNTLQQTFDTFVRTGKLNFADMTRSILSDLAKIAAQKAIVGLVNMGVSAVSGFMGGG